MFTGSECEWVTLAPMGGRTGSVGRERGEEVGRLEGGRGRVSWAPGALPVITEAGRKEEGELVAGGTARGPANCCGICCTECLLTSSMTTGTQALVGGAVTAGTPAFVRGGAVRGGSLGDSSTGGLDSVTLFSPACEEPASVSMPSLTFGLGVELLGFSVMGARDMVWRISMSLMACKLAESKGLKLSSSNSLRLISPSGLRILVESLMSMFADFLLLAATEESVPLVGGV